MASDPTKQQSDPLESNGPPPLYTTNNQKEEEEQYTWCTVTQSQTPSIADNASN